MRKKIALEIFRLVSMLFLIFDKSDEKINCARNFQIRRYDF